MLCVAKHFFKRSLTSFTIQFNMATSSVKETQNMGAETQKGRRDKERKARWAFPPPPCLSICLGFRHFLCPPAPPSPCKHKPVLLGVVWGPWWEVFLFHSPLSLFLWILPLTSIFSSPLPPFLKSLLFSSSSLSHMPIVPYVVLFPPLNSSLVYLPFASMATVWIRLLPFLPGNPHGCPCLSSCTPSILHSGCKTNFIMLLSCLRTPILWRSNLDSSLAPAFLCASSLYHTFTLFIWVLPVPSGWLGQTPVSLPWGYTSHLAFVVASFCFCYEMVSTLRVDTNPFVRMQC